MTGLVVLGATGPFGTRALEAMTGPGLGPMAVAERIPSDGFVSLADAHPDAAVILMGATPSEQRDLAARFGDRVSFGTDAAVAAASEPGCLVVNGLAGLTGLAASVSALEAGNRLVVRDAELVARSGGVVRAAADRGGGDVIVGGPAGALCSSVAAVGIAPAFEVTVVGDGGPLHGMRAEDIEHLAPSDLVMGSPGRVGRAILADAAFALIGAHLLCGGVAAGFGVQFGGGWDAILDVGGETWGHRPAGDAIVRAVGASAAVGLLEPLQSPPDLQEPIGIGARIIDAAVGAVRSNATALAAFGAATDVGVRAFLDRRTGLSTVPEIVERTMDAMRGGTVATVQDALAADREARELATSLLGGMC